MKEKTNNFFATVSEELEKYQEELKFEALEDLEVFTKKMAEQDAKEDEENSEDAAEPDQEEEAE